MTTPLEGRNKSASARGLEKFGPRHRTMWGLCTLMLILPLSVARECSWDDIKTNDPTTFQFDNLLGCTELTLFGTGSPQSSKFKVLDVGAYNLAVALAKPGATITRLTLTDQGVGEGGAAEIAEMLKTNTVLTYLDLGNNNIGVNGAAIVAESLRENYALTTLYVNTPEDEAAIIVEARAWRLTAPALTFFSPALPTMHSNVPTRRLLPC